MNEDLLTIQEAADFLKVSTKTLRRWEARGILVPARTVGNQRRYTHKELEAFKLQGKTSSSFHEPSQALKFQSPLPINPTSFQNTTQLPDELHIQPQSVPDVQDQITTVQDHVQLLQKLVMKNKFLAYSPYALAGVVILAGLFMLTSYGPIRNVASLTMTKDTSGINWDSASVLAAQTKGRQLFGEIEFNIPAIFNEKVTINKDFVVNGKSLFNEDIKVNNKNVDLGTGELTASNVVYGLTAGANITITGDPQNPTISAGVTGGVQSLQGITGAITLAEGSGISLNGLEITNTGVLSLGGQTGDVALTAGGGISVSGTTISNDDRGSAQNIFKNIVVDATTITAGSNNDTLTFAAGSGISITPDASLKKLTITGTLNSQWSTSGSNIYYNLGNVGIGTSNPSSTLDVSGNATISGTLGIGGLGQGIVHANSSGFLSSSALDLAGGSTEVTGLLPVGRGGTGIATTPSAGQLLIGNGTNYDLANLTGTANQISINNAPGSITFATPQDIHTGASPTFAALNIPSNTNQIVLGTGLTNTLTMETLSANRAISFPDASGIVCLSSGNCGAGGGGGTIVGSGTTNYLVKFTSATGISDSLLYESVGKIGLGTTSPQGLFNVSGAPAGQSLVVLNYTGSGENILVGSSSGTTRFAFDASGNLNLASGSYQIGGTSVLNSTTLGSGVINSSLTAVGVLASGSIASGFGNIDVGADSISGGDITSVSSTGFIASGNGAGLNFSGMGNHDIIASSGTLRLGTVTLTGNITGNGQNISGITDLGATGTITFSGLSTGVVQSNGSGQLSSSALNLAGGSSYVTGSLPVTNGGTGLTSVTTGDLLYASGSNTLANLAVGSAGQVLTVSGGVPAWASSNLFNHFQRNSGALSPTNITDDFLIGGSATSSATFQIFANGNATTSGNLTFNAESSIQTTKNQTLTLGGNTTGNIILSPLNGNGTVSSTGNLSLATGKAYYINGTSVLSASTLGSGVTGSSLTSVGALTSGSIASGFGSITTANNITGADVNATGNIKTGAGAGTIRITDSGNLVNIGTTQLNSITYSWPGSDGSNEYVLTTDGAGGLAWTSVTGITGAGDITAIGDVTSGAAFTAAGTQGTSLYFYDADGRGQVTTANLTTARTYTLPDASGTVCLTSGNCAGGGITGTGTSGQIAYFNGSGSIESESSGFAWDSTNNKLGIGTDAPTGKLSVTGASSGKALVVLNETGNQDILTASASGTQVLTLDRSGNVALEGQLSDITHNALTVNDSLNLTTGNAFQINGTNVLSATALGTGVTSSSLTTVGALSSGSIATGFGSILTANAIEGSALTANGAGGGLTFSGTGNHDITASGGTLRLGTLTLNGAVTGNSQDITGLGALSAGGTITFGTFTSNGGILYTNGSGQLAQVTAGTSTQVLKGGTTPSFGAVVLTTDVSGILPIANGGTNANSIGSAGSVPYSNGSSYAFTGVGSGGQVLTSNGSGTPTWTDAGGVGTNYWQRNSGAVAPINITDDLMIGGTSTASAKFQVISGTGNATTSGNLTFSSASSIQTANNNTLTVGGSTTGNIILSPLNGSGVVSSTGDLNVASGKVYQINGTTVLSNNTLGSNVVSSSLTTVGALASGSIASGFGTIATANSISGSSLGISGTTVINSSRHLTNIAGLSSSLTPTAANTYSIGTGAGNQLANLYSQGIYQNGNQVCDTTGNCSGLTTTYWNQNDGALSPKNTTVDLLLGGVATSSAKFAVLNLNSGTPTASIAGATTNNALYLTGDGTIATTNKQTLTLGTASTGNVLIGNGNLLVSGLTNCDSLDTDATGRLICGTDSGGGGGGGTINIQNNGTPVGASVDTVNFGTDFLVSASPSTRANVSIADNALNFSEFADSLTLDAATNLALGGFNLTLGTNSGNGGVLIAPNAGGNSALIINKQGSGDIFSASASGTTRFTLSNAGNLNLIGGVYQSGGVSGITQGAASCVTTTGGIVTGTGTCQLGTEQWVVNNGAISTSIPSLDLLLGSSSTSSAKFAVLNIAGGTPTASLSAGAAGGSYLSATGTLGTTANQSLNLGATGTGNVSLTPGGTTALTAFSNGRVGIGTTAPAAVLEVSGETRFTGTTTANAKMFNSGTVNSSSTGSHYGFQNQVSFTPTGGSLTNLYGFVNVASINSSSITVDNMYAGYNRLDTAAGFSGTITEAFGNYIADPDVQGGTIATNIGLYIQAQTAGTSDYNIYSAGTNTTNHFAGSVGINTTTPLAKLDVRGTSGTTPVASFSGQTASASIIANNDGVGNLFTASKSGATKFTIQNNGNIQFAGTSNFLNTIQTAATAARTYTLPDATGTICLQSSTSCGFATGTNYWQSVNAGTIAPYINTVDLLVGGTATASAKFAITGVAAGTPVATLAATTNNSGLALDAANASIQSLRNNTLTLGGTTTGNIALSPLNGSGVVTANATTVNLTGTTTLNGTSLTAITGGATAINFTEFDVDASTGSITINDGGNAGQISVEGSILDINSLDFTAAGAITTGGSTDLTLNPTDEVVFGDTDTLIIGGHAGNVAYNVMSDSGGSPTSGQINSDDDLYVEGALEASALYQGANQVCDTSGNCSGLTVTYWNQNNGSLSAKNSTVDLLVGGTATSSAKFAVLNVNSGTPTASVSAGTSGATFITADGNIQTTAKQALTLGGGESGSVVLSGFGAGVVQTNAGGVLSSGSISVANGGTGATTFTAGGVLYGNSASPLAASAQGTAGQALISGGSGSPTWTTGTLTLAGNFATSGTSALTLTTTGATNVTLPTTGTLSTLAGTETLSNKTLTTPRFADLGYLADANGNELLIFDLIASAVNEITIGNATTTNGPTIAATGGDTNIALSINSKAAGNLNLNGTATGNILLGGGSGSTGCTLTNSSGAFDCTGAITGSNFSGSSSGTNTGDQTITLTGDVSGSGTGSFATTIGDNAVDGTDISLTSEAQGNLMYFNGTDWVRLANGTANQLLHSGTTPSWSAVSLTADVSGTLPIANGGTNSTATPTDGGVAYGDGTSYQFTGQGSAGNCLLSNGASAPSWGSCVGGTTNFWQQTNGTLAPYSNTLDVLFGGVATSSAKFAFYNVNSGTPTASISAQSGTNSALVLTADGAIQSVKRQTLTLGGSTTGNISLTPNNGTGGRVNVSGNMNLASGFTYQINGTDVLSAGALGSGVTSSSLTTVGALNSGSITSGFGAIDVGSDGITGGDITSAGTTGYVASGTNAGLNFSGAAGTHIIQASAGTLQINAFTMGGSITAGGNNITGLGQLTVDNLRLDGNTFDTTSGDMTINAAGGDIIFSNNAVLNIGGNGSDTAYNTIGDNLALASTRVDSDDDLYVEGNVEIDGIISTINVQGTSGTTPVASFSGQTSFASMVVNNDGLGDLFTASKSGATKFVVTNAGNVGIGTRSPTADLFVQQTAVGKSGVIFKAADGSILDAGSIQFLRSNDQIAYRFHDEAFQSTFYGGSAFWATPALNVQSMDDNARSLVVQGNSVASQVADIFQVANSDESRKYFAINPSGTGTTATISAQTAKATLVVDNSGLGDLFTASKSGKTHFTIKNSGAVLIGNATDGITFDVNNPDAKYTGTARPTRQLKVSAEYAGAILTASGSATTNGLMTSDASSSAALSNYQTYYEWTSAQTSLQDYIVAVRVTLPQDFSAWATSNALQIGYNTELVGSGSNKLDVRVYNGDVSLTSAQAATPVAFYQTQTSSSAKTWLNLTIDDSDIADGTAQQINTAGDTMIIYLKMYSRDNNHVQIGDITLNYLGRN